MDGQDFPCCVTEFCMPCDQQRLAAELDTMRAHPGKSVMLLISVLHQWYFGK